MHTSISTSWNFGSSSLTFGVVHLYIGMYTELFGLVGFVNIDREWAHSELSFTDRVFSYFM